MVFNRVNPSPKVLPSLLMFMVLLLAGCTGPQDGPDDDPSDGTGNGSPTAPVVPTDTDGDGLSDYDEIHIYGTDPTNRDTDDDGLIDGLEVHIYLTDPLKFDTDGDGYGDGDEIVAGSDPLDPKSHPHSGASGGGGGGGGGGGSTNGDTDGDTDNGGDSNTTALGPAPVPLGTAADFAILAKSGISTTGTTAIVGDIGVSPIDSTAITGFGLVMDASGEFATSSLVTGNVYAANYADPTPADLTTAVSWMETAYTNAAGRTNPNATELGAGEIGGMTLVPGLYKWSTGLSISTDVTLSGGVNDTWIFQVAETLDCANAVNVVLAGGAQAKNIYWQVGDQVTLGTTCDFNGNILSLTAIVLNNGATLTGRALAQTAVTLDANAVTRAA